MSSDSHFVGIDFGTSNSTVARYDPRTGQAEVILNTEGEAKTPSMVYFGQGETLVGKPVDELIEDAAAEPEQRGDIFQRTQISIKRRLVNPKRIFLPGGRIVTPVEVAAEILKKLKRDAEEGHFHEAIKRAVITYPAEYDPVQRDVIKKAGIAAGFEEVALLAEPVAGALAYARAGLNVGSRVLVYDLGGGTFDLAVLDNEDDETFQVAMEPRGMERCGGDDFDLALYRYCDEIAKKELGRPILSEGDVDLKFLRLCRRRKENLSWRDKGEFSSLLSTNNGPVRFKLDIDRDTFEDLIDPLIEDTVRLTGEIIARANAGGQELDSVVLIGGSSRVPLVLRRLGETLPVNPLGFDKKDVAVALGAAHYANVRWGEPEDVPTDPRLKQYKEAVQAAVAEGRLNKVKADRLEVLAGQIGLREEQVARVERRVLGSPKRDVLFRQYRQAVEKAWEDGKLYELEIAWLNVFAADMGLDEAQVAACEREVLGANRDEVLGQIQVQPEPLKATGFGPLRTLAGHSDAVLSVAFGPDGRFLASGGADHAVTGWNVHEGRSVGTLAGHSGWANSVAFDPDGRVLASGGFDKEIRVWALSGGEMLHALDHGDWVFSVDISHVDRFLASGGADGEVKLWDLETGKMLRSLAGHAHWVLSLGISPDGRTLVSGGADNMLRVWNLETSEPVHAFEHPDWVHAVGLGPDGIFAATGCEDGTVRTFNVQTGKLICTLAGHPGPVLSVAISSDRRLIASGGAEGKIRIWNFDTGELLDILSGHSGAVTSVAISPDGQLLASGSHDRAIRLWQKTQPAELAKPPVIPIAPPPPRPPDGPPAPPIQSPGRPDPPPPPPGTRPRVVPGGGPPPPPPPGPPRPVGPPRPPS